MKKGIVNNSVRVSIVYSIVQNSSKRTESSETTVVKKQRVENQKSETYIKAV